MFRRKYTVSILNSKWVPIKRNVKLVIIPRADEYIYLNGKYYQVLNVVHTLNDNQDIFIIIEENSKELESIT
jgi:hypothetical protein